MQLVAASGAAEHAADRLEPFHGQPRSVRQPHVVGGQVPGDRLGCLDVVGVALVVRGAAVGAQPVGDPVDGLGMRAETGQPAGEQRLRHAMGCEGQVADRAEPAE